MKYMNMVRLLSVLLCICMFLAACTGKSNPTDDTSTDTSTDSSVEQTPSIADEEPLTGLEPTMDNFFTLFTPTGSPLSTAIRPVNKVDSASRVGTTVLYTKSTVDEQNNVTVTYDVFNTNEGRIVLSLTNTYADGNYDTFDWTNLIVKDHWIDTSANSGEYVFEIEKDKNYPSSVMEVSLLSDYIEVKQAIVTPIDEETHQQNPAGAVYEITTLYTYYDAVGTKIAEFTYQPSVSYAYDGAIHFGYITAYIDDETGELIRCYNAETDVQISAYDYETEQHGYIVGLSEVGIYLEAYDKETATLLFRHYLNNHYGLPRLFLLHNGDMLIQYSIQVEEGDPYDVYDGRYFNCAHSLLDVSEGTATDIELPYIIQSLTWGETMAESLADDGIAVTANARNIAQVTPIVDKQTTDAEVVVFDNDLSVLYTFERLTPEHSFDSSDSVLGFRILPNGDYLVNIQSEVVGADRAIVKTDGTVRAYLKSHYTVADGLIYDANAGVVYDYDLNVLYEFEDEDRAYGEPEYDYITTVGGALLLNIKGRADMSVKYAMTAAENEAGYEISALFDGKKMALYQTDDDYLIVTDEAGRYILCTTAFEHILTSEAPIYVYKADGYFVIETASYVLNQTLIYTVKD